MRSTMISMALLSIILMSCDEKTKEIKRDYVLINQDRVSVEKFDATNINENRYTENNLTFKEGSTFTYDFEHIAPNKEKFLYTWDEHDKDFMTAWKFVPIDSVNENTIQKVAITVKAGLEPMIRNNPDYNQTVIQFNYLLKNGKAPFSSSSGVIDNEANIWMHPPRDKYFRILELNPFPYIKAPFEIGNEWNWELIIGDGWSDERWKVWDGQIENKYNYKITGKKKLKTDLGEIKCFVIESTAKSRIGKTKLTAYFNDKYGFVQLNYSNIDGSKTNLKLSDFSKE